MCEAAIKEPLRERVIDPACGSGTFLFHTIRRLIETAAAENLAPTETVERAVDLVAGIDIHPVAIIFARTTFLLALLPVLREGRPATVAIPVYLGDSLQWNAREFMNVRDLEIVIPAEREAVIPGAGELPDEGEERRAVLRFPAAIAGDPELFDESLDTMLGLAEGDGSEQALEGWLERRGLAKGPDAEMLKETYRSINQLRDEGRNHIWGYVARNLSRPIWLATDAQKADVVLGNPPWLDYRRMGRSMQKRFRSEM